LSMGKRDEGENTKGGVGALQAQISTSNSNVWWGGEGIPGGERGVNAKHLHGPGKTKKRGDADRNNSKVIITRKGVKAQQTVRARAKKEGGRKGRGRRCVAGKKGRIDEKLGESVSLYVRMYRKR